MSSFLGLTTTGNTIFELILQSLLSKADAQVKELRQSIDRIKVESERLEVGLYISHQSLTHYI